MIFIAVLWAVPVLTLTLALRGNDCHPVRYRYLNTHPNRTR